MKVISGKYKGQRIEGFDIEGTRPTMDRVKESLFGIIQNHINDSVVLDLFSGSGNLGIEALSEGASFTYFIDKNKKSIETINRNIKRMGIQNAKVINSDFRSALKEFNIKFDIIFLDPPYMTNYIEESIKLIYKFDLLNNDGIIICESDNLDKIIFPDRYISVKERRYGDKYIVILKKL